MSKRIAVMLGDGFEPVEAMAPVDCMRRAGLDVATVSVMEGKTVTAAQNITIEADLIVSDTDLMDFDGLVIPGGSIGVENLKKCAKLGDALKKFMTDNKFIASICAGPTVLNSLGLLEGKKAKCYPGCEVGFPDGTYQYGYGVLVDGNLLTATGPGQALDFGIAIVKELCGQTKADEVASGMLLK